MTENKTKTFAAMCCVLLSSCTYMSSTERYRLYDLRQQGITVDNPGPGWKKPASPVTAGLLNLLPGMGNLYLGMGDGADSLQLLYGVVNFVTWPFSVLWGVPSAAYDASTINERDLVHYYDRKTTDVGRQTVVRQSAVQQNPVRQQFSGDVYYPGSGYFYNGYYEQNDDDDRRKGYSSCGNCGGNGNVSTVSYNGDAPSVSYNGGGNGNVYNNSSYNVTPYDGNPYTEEYFERQEEDSHKYDWERYYYR